jgi:hypothetical protein
MWPMVYWDAGFGGTICVIWSTFAHLCVTKGPSLLKDPWCTVGYVLSPVSFAARTLLCTPRGRDHEAAYQGSSVVSERFLVVQLVSGKHSMFEALDLVVRFVSGPPRQPPPRS